MTGAARYYRAASSDRREQGRLPGYAALGANDSRYPHFTQRKVTTSSLLADSSGPVSLENVRVGAPLAHKA